MKKLISAAIFTVFYFTLTGASLSGDNIGPAVSQHNGKELKWEEGSRDYFTLFRTLLSRSATGNPNESDTNPQADGCLLSSTKSIVEGNLPDDAVVTDAFLIWTNAHTPDNPSASSNQQYNLPTDNTVTLKFDNGAGITLQSEIAASQAYTIGSSTGFEFESAIYEMDLHGYRMGVYTYRVEITDFFNEILQKGRESGEVNDGRTYKGDYTVEGLDCYNGDPFYKTTMMISNWAVVFVYTSSKIKPKKIYFYNGLNFYRDTQSNLFVSGFELPEDPSVRVSLLTVEGDPGLYNSLFQPEGLLFRANDSQQFLSLWNICNPMQTDYTEVYNSISSYYNWDSSDDALPYCIGGQGGNTGIADIATIDWAIDFDTFLINETTYPGYLTIGDEDFEFMVSANQDTIFSNLMVVSVDTKSPKFDIPESASTDVVPYGREKHSCSCSTSEDLICQDTRPFYYFIRVQNWGEDTAKNVTVQDTLPAQVSYVPGTTEMASKFDENGNGTNWTYIPDGENDGFPLKDPFEVAAEMFPCDKVSDICEDTILLRFMVKPGENLQKHEVITNSAVISDSSGGLYRTNSDVPYRIRIDQNCPSVQECSQPERSSCGGDKSDGGEEDNNNDDLSTDVAVTFEKGGNSPESDEEIIVASPVEDLVMGQISFKGVSEGKDGKKFKFRSLMTKVNTGDQNVNLSNFNLILDKDGNGAIDEEEKSISSGSLDSGYITFLVNPSDQLFDVNTVHYLIISAKADYAEDDIPVNATFSVGIEDGNAMTVLDKGEATVSGEKIEFQSFMLEPTSGFFIVTKGMKDPAVPEPEKINSNISIIQLRLKAVDGANEVNEIKVKTSGADSVSFGKGIRSLSLYLDSDNDGEVHTSLGDELIAEVSDFASQMSTEFKNISIKFNDGEEKHLLINADLNLDPSQSAKITIPNAGVKLKTEKSIYKLPISSKIFLNDCDPMDPNCSAETDDEPGCSITQISENYDGFLLIFGFIVLFLLLIRGPRSSDK